MLNLAIAATIISFIANAAMFMIFVHFFLREVKSRTINITYGLWITAALLDLLIIGTLLTLLITAKFIA